MIEKTTVEELARKLASTVPAGLASAREELEQNFKPVLQSMLGRLDLVTREEFDVQVDVLAHARKQLDALSVQIEQLQLRLAERD